MKHMTSKISDLGTILFVVTDKCTTGNLWATFSYLYLIQWRYWSEVCRKFWPSFYSLCKTYWRTGEVYGSQPVNVCTYHFSIAYSSILLQDCPFRQISLEWRPHVRSLVGTQVYGAMSLSRYKPSLYVMEIMTWVDYCPIMQNPAGLLASFLGHQRPCAVRKTEQEMAGN